MFLYELAIALDKRSTELTEAAPQLGLGELQPASTLTPAQVQAFRAHFAPGTLPPPPLAPMGASASPPPSPVPMGGPSAPAWGPPTGPAVAVGAPPPPPATSAPVAPAAWAAPGAAAPAATPVPMPPGPAPVAPASWGPPTAAPAPAAPAPPQWGPPGPAAPESWSPPGPPTPPAPVGAPHPPVAADPGHAGPYFDYSDAPGTQPGAVATAPPPPPPPGYGGTALPEPEEKRVSTGQLVALGVVGALVLGLFAFMVVNSGPDEKREQAIAQDETSIDDDPVPTLPIPTFDPAEQEAPAVTEPDAYDVVDEDRFCAGGEGVSKFEVRLSAAIIDEDFAEVQRLIRDRRETWERDLDILASGAAPIYQDDIEKYREGYTNYFDLVMQSSSFTDASTKIDSLELTKASNAGQELFQQVRSVCE